MSNVLGDINFARKKVDELRKKLATLSQQKTLDEIINIYESIIDELMYSEK